MNIAGIIARRLWRTLRPHLRRIGRWIIERIKNVAAPRIHHYMLERSSALWEKATRARTSKHRRRHRRRSRRWRSAARWILRHMADLSARVVDELCEAARVARIPLCSKMEAA